MFSLQTFWGRMAGEKNKEEYLIKKEQSISKKSMLMKKI